MTREPAHADAPRLLPAHVYAQRRDWPNYFKAVAHVGVRDTLLRALAGFEREGREPGHAIDLGCGEGKDVAELLRRGWHVTAIDSNAHGLDILRSRPDLPHRERLTIVRAGFEGLSLPKADLVNSSFSLPFCPPEAFPALWEQVVKALPRGGRFAGQLFGDRDDWAGLPDRTHHAPAAARGLFEAFDIEHWQEEDRPSTVDPVNHPKHWHVYHVVARKR